MLLLFMLFQFFAKVGTFFYNITQLVSYFLY